MLDAGLDRQTALTYHQHALSLSETGVGGMANGGAWADIGWCALNLGNAAAELVSPRNRELDRKYDGEHDLRILSIGERRPDDRVEHPTAPWQPDTA